MTTHSERPARSSAATCSPHERAHLRRVEELSGAAEHGRHRPASSSGALPSSADPARSDLPGKRDVAEGQPADCQRGRRQVAADRSRGPADRQDWQRLPARGRRRPPPPRSPPPGRTSTFPRARPGGDDGEEALGQLARPVGADLGARVAQRRIGEAAKRIVGEGGGSNVAGKAATSSVSSTISRTKRATRGSAMAAAMVACPASSPP